MAAAAATVGIPRGRLVARAVLCAFLLGVLWLASALHIARSVQRCLTVEGRPALRDEECRLSIQYPSTMLVVSLFLMFLLWRQEAVLREMALRRTNEYDESKEYYWQRPTDHWQIIGDIGLGVCAIDLLKKNLLYLSRKN